MSLKDFLNVFQIFVFEQLIKILLLKKARKLKSNKAVQNTDIPANIKKNAEFFCLICLSSIQHQI